MGKAGRLGGGSRRSGRSEPPPGLAQSERLLLRQGITALAGGQPDAADAELSQLCAALGRYLEELLLWSGRTDLVKFETPRDLVVRHVLDSLAAVPVIEQTLAECGLQPQQVHACDVGSGAGFPGVPLALRLPVASMVLLERSAARVAFLRTVCAVLHRPGLSVAEADLVELRQPFELLLVRALSPFDSRAIAGLSRALSSAGALLIYQGRSETTAATAARLEPLFADVQIRALEVPFLEADRHLIIARAVRKSC